MNNQLKIVLVLQIVLFTSVSIAQTKSVTVTSPDGKIEMALETGSEIRWSVKHEKTEVIKPSAISLTLDKGVVLGANPQISSIKRATVNSSFSTPFYKKSKVLDHYNQVTVQFKGDYGLILRAYNDGAAYRFFTTKRGMITIMSEDACFNFADDYKAFVPYVRDLRENDMYSSAFEAMYDEIHLSKFVKDSLAISPLLVEIGDGKKAVITEADLQDYPGLFLSMFSDTRKGL